MIITICPKSDNGVNTHLQEIEYVTGLTKHIQIDRYAIKAVNQIKKLNPKLIIFGGSWTNIYEFIAERIKCKKAILFCSPLGQAELSNELPYLSQILEMKNKGLIDYLFCGSKDFENIFKDFIWLPQSMQINNIKIPLVSTEGKRGNLIIGATAPHKNLVNTIAGISISDFNTIKTNIIKQTQTNVLKFMNINIENKGFLSKDDYYRLIRDSKLGFQLSDDESFDYVVLEHMLMGTPILVGKTIAKHYRMIPSLFIVNDIHDSFEIRDRVNKINNLNNEEYDKYCQQFYNIGINIIKERNEIIKAQISKLLKSL